MQLFAIQGIAGLSPLRDPPLPAGLFCHPEGMIENSSTFQGWVRQPSSTQVPKGRLKSRAHLNIIQFLVYLAMAFLLEAQSHSQRLNLPPRPSTAPSGTEFLSRMASMSFEAREQEIFNQIISGNVPDFLRNLAAVQITNVFNGKTNHCTLYVTPDYLAIGSNEDYYLAHMSPNTAQRIADALGCTLPTSKIVDEIYRAAEVKLIPAPIPPSPAMTTVPVFSNHNTLVLSQRAAHLKDHPLGALTAGHQKDVVIASGLASSPGKVAIYGWHKTNGLPIQPLYLKHAAAWVDYSQCIRLVQQKMTVNGETRSFAEVIADPELSALVSNEGTVSDPRYPTNALKALAAITNPAPQSPGGALAVLGSRSVSRPKINFQGFQPTNSLGERIGSFTFDPEVKITINAPPKSAFRPGKKLLIVFYALPNGNTTEQTIGRVTSPGEDWHYDIQHIGAQTRFLRQEMPDRTVILVYLENDLKSWPAWRKKHGSKLIPDMVHGVRRIFAADAELVLTGHSGGGSFTFGYLNEVEAIPDEIVRIAFLDSNYAYDPALGHKDKLVHWLEAQKNHFLCVLAYNDAVALLEGKPFVSAAGGTWGKSHQMQEDLAQEFKFVTRHDSEFQRFTALNGRIQFILKENPGREIFHTKQVELNGFIHAMFSGTKKQNKGYEYFRGRAYSVWISKAP
jgi:hypothetical protein